MFCTKVPQTKKRFAHGIIIKIHVSFKDPYIHMKISLYSRVSTCFSRVDSATFRFTKRSRARSIPLAHAPYAAVTILTRDPKHFSHLSFSSLRATCCRYFSACLLSSSCPPLSLSFARCLCLEPKSACQRECIFELDGKTKREFGLEITTTSFRNCQREFRRFIPKFLR